MSACTSARPVRYALFAVEPDDDEEDDEDDDVVLDEPPLDDGFVSDDEEDDESEPLLADSFTFSFAPPFELERLSVL